MQLALFRETFHDPTTGKPLRSASVEIFREGATANGASSGTSPLTVTVRHIGKIKAADTVFIVSDTNAASDATTYAVDSVASAGTSIVISGFVGTLNVASGSRIVPQNAPPTLYTDDQGAATKTNPLTTDAYGLTECFLPSGPMDYIATRSGASTGRLFYSESASFIQEGIGIINVTSPGFGALGDGTTDDSSAIQAAINMAETSGLQVYFPPGRYLVGTGLTASSGGFSMIGPMGRYYQTSAGVESNGGATLIADTDSMTLFSFDGGATIQENSLSIIGLNFSDRTDARPSATLVKIKMCNYWTIRDCNFAGSSVGVIISSAKDASSGGDASWGVLDHCNFINVVTGVTATDDDGDSSNVGVPFFTTRDCGFSLGGTGAGAVGMNILSGWSQKIVQCKFDLVSDAIGVKLSSRRGHFISGCFFEMAAIGTTGINFASSSGESSVIGCLFVGSNVAGWGDAIVANGTDNDGISIVGCAWQNARTAVSLNATAANNHILGGYIRGVAAPGQITIASGATQTDIVGLASSLSFANTISNSGTGTRMWGAQFASPVSFTANDATPSVSSGQGVFKTANTGATTITAFDDGFSGQVIHVIIGDANTTIDFTGTNLEGNAGGDWSPTTNDHMTCVYDGTNWFCRISDNTA